MIESKQITSMAGATIDISTGRLWSGRVFYERVPALPEIKNSKASPNIEDEAFRDQVFDHLASECTVVSSDDVPRSIVHHFRQEPVEGLVLY